jgi:hypothetical protein
MMALALQAENRCGPSHWISQFPIIHLDKYSIHHAVFLEEGKMPPRPSLQANNPPQMKIKPGINTPVKLPEDSSRLSFSPQKPKTTSGNRTRGGVHSQHLPALFPA